MSEEQEPNEDISFLTSSYERHHNISSACEDMVPKHGNHTPQITRAPYIIDVDFRVATNGLLKSKSKKWINNCIAGGKNGSVLVVEQIKVPSFGSFEHVCHLL